MTANVELSGDFGTPKASDPMLGYACGPERTKMDWNFWGEHWFLAWSALWLVWGAILLPVAVASLVAKLANRILRTIKVAARGWPPAHLDADGGWRPLPEEKKA